MASLKNQIKYALDESRMLVLGSQVLIGFQYRMAFEPAFEGLSEVSKQLEFIALLLLALVFALLVTPSAYNRLTVGGKNTEAMGIMATRIVRVAMIPFALALSTDFYIVAARIFGPASGMLAAAITFVICGMFWFGIELVRLEQDRKKMGNKNKNENVNDEDNETSLSDKVDHVLTEARVVLPGAQALLGFQFITTLMEAFDKIPSAARYAHFGSLCFTAASIVLLMTLPAYHRIVEKGEETSHFLTLASRMLMAAMAMLAPGICGGLFIVGWIVIGSARAALLIAAAGLCVFVGLWFVFPLIASRKHIHTYPS